MADLSKLIPIKGLTQQHTPERLLELFMDYVEHNKTEGLVWVWERVKYKDSSKLEATPKRVPLTTKAFCIFARISHITFSNYLNETSSTYKDFNEVAQYIKDFCAVDVFNGAAVGTFNGNLAAAIIKKDFGITDEDESKGGRNVDTIRHEIAFSDYTDVTNAGSLPPATEELHQLIEGEKDVPSEKALEKAQQLQEAAADSERLGELNHATRQARPEEWEYDNMPNTSSRHHNMAEFRERNGIFDEET